MRPVLNAYFACSNSLRSPAVLISSCFSGPLGRPAQYLLYPAIRSLHRWEQYNRGGPLCVLALTGIGFLQYGHSGTASLGIGCFRRYISRCLIRQCVVRHVSEQNLSLALAHVAPHNRHGPGDMNRARSLRSIVCAFLPGQLFLQYSPLSFFQSLRVNPTPQPTQIPLKRRRILAWLASWRAIPHSFEQQTV